MRLDHLFIASPPARLAANAVTFEPRARTAWHNRSYGQLLLVTAGCGWVQAWGEPVQLVRPGDVVWFAPGEKHGHGATAVTGMSHVAVQEAHGGVSAACLEPVPEETYRAGPPPA